MKIAVNYNLVPGINTQIILSDSRDQYAKKAAAEYCKLNNKHMNNRILEAFERDAGAYHAVRNLIEDIKTIDFNDVLKEFKLLYPLASEDWKSALKCGLLVKAGNKIGGYSTGEYIYNDETAQLIRSHNLNTLDPIIEILFNQ